MFSPRGAPDIETFQLDHIRVGFACSKRCKRIAHARNSGMESAIADAKGDRAPGDCIFIYYRPMHDSDFIMRVLINEARSILETYRAPHRCRHTCDCVMQHSPNVVLAFGALLDAMIAAEGETQFVSPFDAGTEDARLFDSLLGDIAANEFIDEPAVHVMTRFERVMLASISDQTAMRAVRRSLTSDPDPACGVTFPLCIRHPTASNPSSKTIVLISFSPLHPHYEMVPDDADILDGLPLC